MFRLCVCAAPLDMTESRVIVHREWLFGLFLKKYRNSGSGLSVSHNFFVSLDAKNVFCNKYLMLKR